MSFRDPTITYNPISDEYLAAWAEGNSPLGNSSYTIFTRRLSATGAPIGPEQQVSPVGNVRPDIAHNDATNEYLMTWERDSENSNIYGRTLNSLGTGEGSEFRISDFPTSKSIDASKAQVAFNATSGTYLATWIGLSLDEFTSFAPCCEVYAQAISAAGVPTGPDLQISDDREVFYDEDDAPGYPGLAAGGSGFVAAWPARNAATLSSIEAQQLDADGGKIGEQLLVHGDPDTANVYPEVEYNDSTGQYLVAWERAEIMPSESTSVRGQLIDDGKNGTAGSGPKLKLGGKKKQSNKKMVVVTAKCNEDCSVVVKSKGKLKVKPARAKLKAGKSKKLKLKFTGKRTKRLVKNALGKRKGKATLKLKGTATDDNGKKGSATFKVTLKKGK